MSDSEIIEYGMKHGSAVMGVEFTKSMDFENVLESLATMPSSAYGSPAHIALVERANELRGGV